MKTDKVISKSASIRISPKKICDVDQNCTMVNSYYSTVLCKKKDSYPGNFRVCGEHEMPPISKKGKGFKPSVGDDRYKWTQDKKEICLNPDNLSASEKNNLEKVERSRYYKCSCDKLSEFAPDQSQRSTTTSESTTSKRTEAKENFENVGPPESTNGTATTPQDSEQIGPGEKKYCHRVMRTTDLAAKEIITPGDTLKKGKHNFEVRVENIGPSKCCEFSQITEVFKEGKHVGSLILHQTNECYVNWPDGKGLEGKATTVTGPIKFKKKGNYNLKVKTKCLFPKDSSPAEQIASTTITID